MGDDPGGHRVLDRPRHCWTRAGIRRPRTPRRSGWPTTPGSSRWSRWTPPTTRRRPSATARLWAERTPAGFTFNIKAFSLLTGHPTRVSALYKDLRPETDKKNVYPDDLPAQAYEEVWTRFLSALDPLVEAGKLGALLFQFPPWFTIRRANKQYLLEVAKRCAPLRPVFEFRHASWFDGDNADETLDFLREHKLPYVCVDMPQGHRSSLPAGAGRHRGPRGGALPRPQRQVDQQGHPREVRLPLLRSASWPTGRRSCASWPTQAGQTHVLMNNCYSRLRPDATRRPSRVSSTPTDLTRSGWGRLTRPPGRVDTCVAVADGGRRRRRHGGDGG